MFTYIVINFIYKVYNFVNNIVIKFIAINFITMFHTYFIDHYVYL